jgi:hypothetical protein
VLDAAAGDAFDPAVNAVLDLRLEIAVLPWS